MQLRRFIIPGVICLFWVVMMGLLIQREVGVERAKIAGEGIFGGPRETWFAVFLPGRVPAGHIRIEEAREQRSDVPGIVTRIQARAQIVLLGRATRIRTRGELWRALNGETAEFEVILRSDDHRVRVEGDYADGMLDAKLHTAGEEIALPIAVGDSFNIAASGIGLHLDVSGWEVGEEYKFEAFDPTSFSMGDSRVKVLRHETLVLNGDRYDAIVAEIISSGQTSTAWLDEHGETLRIETALGFTLERSTQQFALENLDPEASGDFLAISSVRPTGAAPFRGATRMRFRVSGLDGGQALEVGGPQTSEGDDTYSIVVPDLSAQTEAVAIRSEDFLQSTPFEQSSHPLIVKKSAQIVGDAAGEWEKAQRIYTWVYEKIEKNPVVSLPSALEVLESREGDCNEHTVLFTALARAAGVPTRIAIGLVWSDELAGFYYHAWPEVFTDRWIPMDPTLGQSIADATHIKLLTGSIQEWTRLTAYLAKIQIEILEIE